MKVGQDVLSFREYTRMDSQASVVHVGTRGYASLKTAHTRMINRRKSECRKQEKCASMHKAFLTYCMHAANALSTAAWYAFLSWVLIMSFGCKTFRCSVT